MIERIWSSMPTFRTVYLKPGANVIMASRAADSEETDSTNGLGKTTLLRIINFCFGSDLTKDKVLSHPDLSGVTFGLDWIIGGKSVTIQRNTANPEVVVVSNRLLSENVGVADGENVKTQLAIEAWKDVLTKKFYGSALGSAPPIRFRDLFAYLVRIGKDAFVDPQQAFKGHPGAAKRLSTSFLIGLNWTKQNELQTNFNLRAELRKAHKALQSLGEGESARSVGELEAERVALDTEIRRKSDEVKSFNVREDYRLLEDDLREVDLSVHALINDNHGDERLKEYYTQSSVDVNVSDEARPVTILKAAGAVFSQDALRHIEDVIEFHREVYKNRREFLRTEIVRLKDGIARRSAEIDRLLSQKRELLGILQGSGAIDDLVMLQKALTDIVAKRESVVALIAERKRHEARDDKLTQQIDADRALLRSDLAERQETVDQARELFAEYMRMLYGKPGRLSVDVGSDGYQISFNFDRKGSDGVEQMVVFCFDLMVATLWAKKGMGFNFLAHDSTLFADVDPRQIASALKLAAQESEKHGFQYLCCLNQGAIGKAEILEFNIQSRIRLMLSDKGPDGRLLGVVLPQIEQDASRKRTRK